MESLDDVIDAMIADRVIHRHRRKWLIAFAVVVVLALVVLFTGGWKEKQGRTVPTLNAPVTVTAGRWEFNFKNAEILRTPKGEYNDAKAKLRVYFDAKNVDTEQHTTHRVDGGLMLFVPGKGQDNIESNGGSCHGVIGWTVVYGLPPEPCYTEFDVAPDFTADQVEIGVLAESFDADNSTLGADDTPYWHNETPSAVIRLKPKVIVDKGEDS
ncbi:hypothetical protein [Kribbella sp. NPDC055071]